MLVVFGYLAFLILRLPIFIACALLWKIRYPLLILITVIIGLNIYLYQTAPRESPQQRRKSIREWYHSTYRDQPVPAWMEDDAPLPAEFK